MYIAYRVQYHLSSNRTYPHSKSEIGAHLIRRMGEKCWCCTGQCSFYSLYNTHIKIQWTYMKMKPVSSCNGNVACNIRPKCYEIYLKWTHHIRRVGKKCWCCAGQWSLYSNIDIQFHVWIAQAFWPLVHKYMNDSTRIAMNSRKKQWTHHVRREGEKCWCCTVRCSLCS